MSFNRVLIFHANLKTAQPIAAYFSKVGKRVWGASTCAKACQIAKKEKPDLIFIDIHAPEAEWIEVLDCITNISPATKVIITNKHPDVRRELIAQERGISVFLREPFTTAWILKALERLDQSPDEQINTRTDQASDKALPKVRMPVRIKITLPYALLAMLFALGATYLVSRYVLESFRERFTAQLIDAGRLSSDWMVQEEDRILETVRLVANTEGVAEGIQNSDSEFLREIIYPIALNSAEETVVLLDQQGVSLLSLASNPAQVGEYRVSKYDDTYRNFEFVQRVLQKTSDRKGDKYAGLAQSPEGNYFYIAGPVFDTAGNQVGVVLVGKSLKTIANEIRRDTLAQVSIYDLNGDLLASTLFLYQGDSLLPHNEIKQIIQRQDGEALIRELRLGSETYSEILGAYEARGGVDFGIVGIAFAQNFILRPTVMTGLQTGLLVIGAFLMIVFLGVVLAHQITQPLSNVVKASVEIAKGNLEVKVPAQGNDEIMVLAHAFNYMVSGLQEGGIYRDLLGRTVSPEVREALRTSFATGDLRLEGQTAIATVLMSDIRGFTSLAEKEDPTTILTWLNEYFGEVAPVITNHGGVIDKFEGDAMLAFFGILPKPISATESAYQACQAAVEMLRVIEKINARRELRAEPAFITGIGINTGSLTAGGLGTSDRLNYTIIGDSVNTTQRMEGITRRFGESGVVISEHTLAALAGRRGDFRLEPLGEHNFKGKEKMIWLYRLFPNDNGDGKPIES